MKTSDPIECSQTIADHLVRNVPAAWRRIEVHVEIEHEAEMVTTECIYYPPDPDAPKDWFGIEDAYQCVLFQNCFIQLAHAASMPERGLFKRCTFTLESDGRYRTEFQY